MTFVLQNMIHYRFLNLWLLLLLPFGEGNRVELVPPPSNASIVSLLPIGENTNSDSLIHTHVEEHAEAHHVCYHGEAITDRYHRVSAKAGDNIFVLLKRYELHAHQCNFDRFYALNDLNRESKLIKGRKYYIPVLIYTYNGKSIRSTIGIDTWEQALRIKRYNERMLKEGNRNMTLTASNVLWVGYHELYCLDGDNSTPPDTEPIAAEPIETDKQKANDTASNVSESYENNPSDKLDSETIKKLEANGGIRKYPIFGPKNSYVRLIDNSLRGKVYYVVSGHGGPDPGAIGKQKGKTLCEDEYAYDVSLRLTRQLLQRGALVYMIIRDKNDGLRSGKYLGVDNDEYCWGNYRIPASQKKRLAQRSSAVNTLYEKHKKQGIKEQYCVVVHIDSRSTSVNTDVFFYHFPGSKEGRKLAKNMHRTFKNKYRIHRRNGNYHGTVTPRDLHMLREPKPTSVFIELGNIRNKNDQKRIVVESNREALARWMYEGLK
ncbi:MAG: N-acetylmuramoyl-L-alanine amidase [Saprospiraceae bacterium]